MFEVSQRVFGFLYAEKIVIVLIVTSAVETFPLPGQPFYLYTFLYARTQPSVRLDWSR